MEVVAIVGKTGTRAYLAGCVQSRRAALFGPLAEDLDAYRDALTRRGWELLVEFTYVEATKVPLIAPIRVSPRAVDEVAIEVGSDKRRTRVPVHAPDGTLDPELPAELLVARIGAHEVRVIACSAQPAEVAWRVGGSVFTDKLLFAPGVWPAAATPPAVLSLQPTTAVYPRRAQDGHTVSTVALERAWLTRWEARGYNPDIPDPSATVRSFAPRRAR
jgi:hypothetical protein